MENYSHDSHSHSLHHLHFHKTRSILNLAYCLAYILALITLFYYRLCFFFFKTEDKEYHNLLFKPWILSFAVELLYSFIWSIKQPMNLWPVTRTVFPENLPNDDKLPGIDVFICTVDPDREPTFEVMNTVISAMSLDYPPKKLSVYLSDDGGAYVTLYGIKQAWAFATWWLPFSKRFNLKTICPRAFFQNPDMVDSQIQTQEFFYHRKIVQEKFEAFNQRIRSMEQILDENSKTTSRDHPPLVQVIDEKSIEEDDAILNLEAIDMMPRLVYVAREKRASHLHNFKAGALNTLLRVSSIISNFAYILVLDCDMYCNDSSSARQAVCFFLDPKISPSLGWVQFPQKFHNISQTDIYDSQYRVTWPVYWTGISGLQGPTITGTNVFINRKAFYGLNIDDGLDLKEARNSLGSSSEFIKSLRQIEKPNSAIDREISSVLLKEAHYLASCTYEKGTKWGQKVGFWYNTIVEDVFTSHILQSKGWRSVYLNPERPQFLGSATTTLDQMLVQGIRWYGGFADVVLSKYFPLFYRPSKMGIFQKMYYCWMFCMPIDFILVLWFAFVPPLCFLYGIPLYPKVSDPFFAAFAFVYVSSQLKHLCDIAVLSGGPIKAWLNEQRIWIVKGLSCYLYGTIECIITKMGIRKLTFNPTNKVQDNDTTYWYQMEKYDFRTSNLFLIPIVTAVTLNMACLVGGVARLNVAGNWEAMFAQMILSIYALVMSFPVIEAMFLRNDDACIPLTTTMMSIMLTLLLLSFGNFLVLD
ncbi:cellulose synthase-like protein E6 [Amaranthus tricolor]|uniref:cellulose synthase-like protein E6 n=1 Tax=Amaranthus tricolor TaxID=29722 RepID=UPI0025860E8D|nr:cellulose synthase-like protein E6 [Amaranthus tricolor]